MPKLVVRKPNEVPAPSHTSRAVLEQQRLYESFIQSLDGNVGELESSEGETLRDHQVASQAGCDEIGVRA